MNANFIMDNSKLENLQGMGVIGELEVTDEVRVGNFVARRVSDTLDWGMGAIQPLPEYADPVSERALVTATLENIDEVKGEEMSYSCCTDGRCPLHLATGEDVPVREQLVGADVVSAFHIAETLGSRFYKNPNAPVQERVMEVVTFLHDNGLTPSTHFSCGAANGYEVISKNSLTFFGNDTFMARSRSFMPEGVYDDSLHDQIVRGTQERLDKSAYEDLNGDVFVQAVEKVSGLRAIAELNDDGRGVHGHVEELIMRLRFRGKAINETKLTEVTGGREVFGVNDPRMDMLAQLFGRGNDQDTRLARMAVEYFANAGHGTLAKSLPTWVIEEVQ